MTNISIKKLLEEYPFAAAYFEQNKLTIAGFEDQTFEEFLNHFSEEELEDQAIDKAKLLSDLPVYLDQMRQFWEWKMTGWFIL
ncbi:hypothetical protein [Lacrimispora xylanisolvens]|uniref:hypothetical protein n=1 Tax=Lacrimispora xylanisolvens TaxID=384636 RepID=UPI0032E8007F